MVILPSTCSSARESSFCTPPTFISMAASPTPVSPSAFWMAQELQVTVPWSWVLSGVSSLHSDSLK